MSRDTRTLLQIHVQEQLRQSRNIGLDVWLFENRVEVYLPADRKIEAPRPLLAGRSDLLDFERDLVRLVDYRVDHATASLFETGDPLYLVSSDNHVPALHDRGISRGQIWTRDEASDLLALPYPSPDVTRAIVDLKLLADAELVGGELIITRRDPHSGVCLSTLFWESVHGQTICAICHPPASPDLVKRWSGIGRLSESPTRATNDSRTHTAVRRCKRRAPRLDEWMVYKTDDHTLDVHHIALAHLVDAERIVARVRARSASDALKIVRAQGQTIL